LESNRYYAGIGSRETPTSLKPTIERIVKRLNELGYTLRSGGASGADSFFEEHADKKEIFLPWKNFNGNSSNLFNLSVDAYKMAAKHHPAYEKLSVGARKMMARNCYQVMGEDLHTPIEFVICWTKDGKASGGTGQAIRIAEHWQIPVWNLKDERILKVIGLRLGIPEWS
jgi:hypothetical protein